MRKFTFVILLSIIFLSSWTGPWLEPVAAQDQPLEECQNYYQFGEVKVNLNTKKSSYSQGEKIELFGTIINNNTFPLLNITLFAHLKRLNEETFLENGHFLVDRLTLTQNLNFLPKETKELSVAFPVKDNYPQGQYQLQYFVFSKEGFYYSGRPFLEEDFAGVTNFEIRNTVLPEVLFDLETLSFNGVPQKVRDYLPIFKKEQNPAILIMLKDLRKTKSDLLVDYQWYRWDDSFTKNLVKTGQLLLLADRPPVFQTIFDLPEPGAYVLYLEMNKPVRSLFKFRIARRGEKADRLRMNDLGITNYPIDPKKDRAFVCFHSPSEESSPRTRVTLSLWDKKGAALEQKAVEDSFGGEVTAISLPLTKLADPLNFSIKADFQNLEDPSLSQETRHDFNCHLFDRSLTNISVSYQDSKINLRATNLCGDSLPNPYAEKLIIYQNGQIIEENYNLRPIPSEIDTANLPPGEYKLSVKSGQIEKEMEFTVGKKVERKLLFLIIFALIIPLSLTSLIVFRKGKRKQQ